jgi:hypothetical protein
VGGVLDLHPVDKPLAATTVKYAAPLRPLRGAPAALHIYISHPALRDDLRAFLEHADCVVRESHPQELEVEIPHAPSEEQARRELDIYLASWQVMNRGVETYVVTYDRQARN